MTTSADSAAMDLERFARTTRESLMADERRHHFAIATLAAVPAEFSGKDGATAFFSAVRPRNVARKEPAVAHDAAGPELLLGPFMIAASTLASARARPSSSPRAAGCSLRAISAVTRAKEAAMPQRNATSAPASPTTPRSSSGPSSASSAAVHTRRRRRPWPRRWGSPARRPCRWPTTYSLPRPSRVRRRRRRAPAASL